MTDCLQAPCTESQGRSVGGVRGVGVAASGADSEQTTRRRIADEHTEWHGIIARVPEQRDKSHSSRSGGRPRDARGRFIKVSAATPLPDSGGLAPVCAGRGVSSPVAFTFAGIDWTSADAGIDGSPIGFRLASELHHAARSPTPSDHVGAERGVPRG
jgi:hypothetical protein